MNTRPQLSATMSLLWMNFLYGFSQETVHYSNGHHSKAATSQSEHHTIQRHTACVLRQQTTSTLYEGETSQHLTGADGSCK